MQHYSQDWLQITSSHPVDYLSMDSDSGTNKLEFREFFQCLLLPCTLANTADTFFSKRVIINLKKQIAWYAIKTEGINKSLKTTLYFLLESHCYSSFYLLFVLQLRISSQMVFLTLSNNLQAQYKPKHSSCFLWMLQEQFKSATASTRLSLSVPTIIKVKPIAQQVQHTQLCSTLTTHAIENYFRM